MNISSGFLADKLRILGVRREQLLRRHVPEGAAGSSKEDAPERA